jgi:TRAP-type C4-dicarboxylate transport system substrate-binding protein
MNTNIFLFVKGVKHMKHKISLMVLTFYLMALLAFAQNEAITLRLAISDQQGISNIEPYVTELIAQVKTLSKGTIIIEPIWRAGDDTEAGYEAGVVEHVIKGDFELGVAASRSWDNAGVTSLQALQAPFLIDNDALAEAVATSEIAKKMLENLSSAGIVGLTLWPEDLRHPFSLMPDKPLLSPEDFAGLQIRTIPIGISYALIKALGATPMLEDSAYQGAESGLRGALTSLIGAPIATGNVTFFPKFQVLFANAVALEQLSDEQRTVLHEAAAATQRKAIAEHPSEVDAAKAWCDNGGSIVLASDEQITAFDKVAQPVFDQIEQDPKNVEFVAAIRDLKVKTEPSPGAEACGPTAAQASVALDADTEVWSAGLPPDGVWQVELTAEDLEGMGLVSSNAADWAGVHTWTFQDGKGLWQLQGTGSLYCKNTYEVVEDVVRFSYITDCTSQVHDIQWRLGNDGLHLHLVATKNAPETQFKASLEAKPWQKVGEPSIDTEVWEKGLPPDGLWQHEMTSEDFVDMGIPRSEAENWVGVFTWTFQDGKATLRAEQKEPWHCEGTYAVVEDVVRINFTGGICGHDIADMQWRLQDDGLHLHLVDIKLNFRLEDVKYHSLFLEYRSYFETKPWQKVE